MVEMLVKGRRGARVVPLVDDDRPLVIGRKGKLRIDDRRISRQHARVVRRDDAWYLEDLGSTNGTYLNRVRVSRTERVEPGDTIRIGNTSIILREPSAAAANAVSAIVPASTPRALRIPDQTGFTGTSLAATATRDCEEAPRGWGPILLVGTTLALLISVLVNVIAYARTTAALRELGQGAERRAEERDLHLIAALRSDLRKPPAGLAELATTLEQARRLGTDERTRDNAGRSDEQFAQFRQELAEIRRTLDGVDTKLGGRAPQPSQQPETSNDKPIQHASSAVDGGSSTTRDQLPHPQPETAKAATATRPVRVHTVFVVDASRSLGAALPQVLRQVRLAASQLAPHQSCRILVAREGSVVETSGETFDVAHPGHPSAEAEGTAEAGGAATHRAIALALKMSPQTLHVFTDNPGDRGMELRDLLKAGFAGGIAVNVTHFYSREFREDLKAVARDHGGMYSFIAH